MINRKESIDKPVPNWLVTSTTISCETVGREATIMVYKNWSTACAYHKRWGPVRWNTRRGIGRAFAWLGIVSDVKYLASGCPGPVECPKIGEYQNRLYDEEIELHSEDSK